MSDQNSGPTASVLIDLDTRAVARYTRWVHQSARCKRKALKGRDTPNAVRLPIPVGLSVHV